MQGLPEPISTNQAEPEIPREQAAIANLAREIIDLKKELNDQRKENKDFILWVIGGVVAIVLVVAIEIIIFHTRDDKDFVDLQNQYFQEVKDVSEQQFDMELRLQREIDSLKNPSTEKPSEIELKK